jgi:hypothetical protein
VKLATYGTQDKEKPNKNTTQHVSDTTITQTITNNVNKTRVLLQTTGEIARCPVTGDLQIVLLFY